MIPFMDLKGQFDTIKDQILPRVQATLASGQYVMGPETAALEQEFAEYCQVSHGIAVNSGTSALHLALLAAGVGPGDEVITVPFTFVASVAAIRYIGATPIFIDIDPSSYTMNVSAIEKAITPKTKAILPVHLYGQSADMDPIVDIAKHFGLVVIEDAAQAHGAEYKGRRTGSLGDIGCFSFYPGKNLGAYGEGGMVVTNHPDLAKRVRMQRDWGQEKKYHHVLPGFNYRMDEIQAAILRVKLTYLEEWTEARRNCARLYDRLLFEKGISPPYCLTHNRHVYHIYAIRVGERSAMQQFLSERGVATGIHYPFPIHVLPPYADLGYEQGDFPEAELAAQEVLSLPMYPELPHSCIEEVVDGVQAYQTMRVCV